MIDRTDEHLPWPPEPASPLPASQWAIDAVYRCGEFVLLTPLDLPNDTPIVLQVAVRVSGTTAQIAGRDATLVPRLELETIEAVYKDGTLQPLSPTNLPDETPIRLQMLWRLAMLATLRLDSPPSEPQPPSAPDTLAGDTQAHHPPADADGAGFSSAPASTRDIGSARFDRKNYSAVLALPLSQHSLLAVFARLDMLLFGLGMLVYALMRSIGLTTFPIFFFCDEAIHTNQGLELIRNGLRDSRGLFLPPYFRNSGKWNLSLSVYLHGASALLFGNSVLVNRATSASVTLLAGVAVALTLRLIIKLRFWWAGPLVLAALPVWFLHSRTSFEAVLMVSFYTCFLCAYLLYRYHDPRYLIAAIVCGAATFYSYANGQGVMFVSCALLLLSDLRYHVRILRSKPRLLFAALIAAALVAVQYVRFQLLYPSALVEHLELMDSIWMHDVPLSAKLSTFAQNYLLGLSPTFWFAPNNGVDLHRHTFKDWGNFPLIFLPLVLLGLWVCLRQWRSAAHRAVLIAILAAPFSASLAYIHNYRVLAMVVPAAILVCLGIERLASWLIARRVPAVALALGCAAGLLAMNIAMLRDSLVNGPTWYSDYGLYGMQYGAAQVFPAISADLAASAQSDVVVSPDWANNPNEFVPFFLPQEQRARVSFTSPPEFLTSKRDLRPTTIYVLPAEDYDKLRASGKLVIAQPTRVLPYPNGQPGFYFVRMRYVDNIDAILEAEREARRKLVEDTATIDGQTVRVAHSRTDLGSVTDLFDNDRRTLIRGFEANPLVFEFVFPKPRAISGIGLDYWPVDLRLTVTVVPDNGDKPQTFTATYRNPPLDPHVDLNLPNRPIIARKLRIEILDLHNSDVAKIHVPGIQLR